MKKVVLAMLVAFALCGCEQLKSHQDELTQWVTEWLQSMKEESEVAK